MAYRSTERRKTYRRRHQDPITLIWQAMPRPLKREILRLAGYGSSGAVVWELIGALPQ